MLDYKVSLGTCKKIEVLASIFSNHNAMKLEINYKKKKGKTYKHKVPKQYATKQLKD